VKAKKKYTEWMKRSHKRYRGIFKISPTKKIEVRFTKRNDGSTNVEAVSEEYDQEVDKNKKTGQVLLKKFEENAKGTMEKLLKGVRKNANDVELKKKYFKARAIYNKIAEETG